MAWKQWWMMGGMGASAMLFWVVLELAGWASFRPSLAETSGQRAWKSSPAWPVNVLAPTELPVHIPVKLSRS